jgi:hypothetical protein
MTKDDALRLMLEQGNAANDLDPVEEDLPLVLDEPKRQHLVKKVRDKTLQEVANLIRKFQLNDERSLEILQRAEQVQRKVYRKPRKNRKGGRSFTDSRILDMDILVPYGEEVLNSWDMAAPYIPEQVPNNDSGTTLIRVPLIP